MDFILASQSPRRKELLKKIVPSFTVCPSSVNESKIDRADPVEFAIEAATQKAKAVASRYPSATVLGADTVVTLDRKILGKPKDEEEARKTLLSLSQVKHKVITAIALYKKDEDKLLTDYELTYVEFNRLSEKDIEEYIATGDWADKAGSYAIQKTGDKFVRKIQGDYDNVVGLPVSRLKKLINKFNKLELSVEIGDIALPNNYGIAKHEGKIYFVPGAQLGSKILIRESKKRKGIQFADLVKEEAPSPFYEKPLCPHFGPCGGCIFQNLKYEKQLELKANYLKRTLKSIGKYNTNSHFPVSSSPKIYNYRNKMEFAFGEKDGKVVLGLRERSHPLKKYTRKTIEITRCDIFSPIVKEVFSVFIDFANNNKLAVYDTTTHKGFLRHLVIREGKNSGEVMLVLVTAKGECPGLFELIKKLPLEIKSFYWIKNNQLSDVVSFEEIEHLYGEKHITDTIGNKQYRIYPQTFFQPNTGAAELLYDKILEFANLRKDDTLLELYCGAGSIGIYLADQVEKVIGIDIMPENIQTAKENAKINNLTNCTFYESDAEKCLKQNTSKFDLLVVDPPRGGLSNKALRQVIGLSISKIIYVSCNPATLARDLAILNENGYKIKNIAAIDLFPHTAHLETVVSLSR